MIPKAPITIEDRVAHRQVELAVRIEADKVDEFAQEIEGLMHTLGGQVVRIRAYPITERGAGERP